MTTIGKALTKISRSDVIEFLVEDQFNAMQNERDRLEGDVITHKVRHENALKRFRESVEEYASKKLAKQIEKIKASLEAAEAMSEDKLDSSKPFSVSYLAPGGLGLMRQKIEHTNDEKERNRPSRAYLMPHEVSESRPVGVQVKVERQGYSRQYGTYVYIELKLSAELVKERMHVAELAKKWDDDYRQWLVLKTKANNRDSLRSMIRTRLSVAALQGTPDGVKLIESLKALGLVNGALTTALVKQATDVNTTPITKQIETGEPLPIRDEE